MLYSGTVSCSGSEASGDAIEFKRLGSGTIGAIYHNTGLPGVFKKCHTTDGCETLRNEHRQLQSIYASLTTSGNPILAPTPLGFYESTDSEFWEDLPILPARDAARTCMYAMSRVYPLPSALRKKIIKLFCPENLRGHPSITAPKSHLARILLGRPSVDPRRTAPQKFFDTYNFPLTRDRAELIGINVVNTAIEMGRLLAQMHMTAKNDARDIEIVLGANVTSEDSSRFREPRIWVVDFNQVSSFDRTEEQIPRLVDAFFTNEAYFPRPRPSDNLYREFSRAYIAECGKIDNVAVRIGGMFIEALENEQAVKAPGG